MRVDTDWPEAFRRAAEMSLTHASATGARSLDVLHVAIAKLLGLQHFASFDTRQRALAALVGLTIVQ
jgi:predicted nucleic acid-binding protein